VRTLEQRRAAARLAAAVIVRDAYEACVAVLRGALCDHLEALRETDGYPAVLRALIEESLAALPAASRLRVDPRDAQLARAILDELHVRLELEPGLETIGGVEVAARDGRTVRNTLEERLRNAEARLRVLAGEFLEPVASSVTEEALP
jgi:vacuolar-type H+-ATPase subunit E/Vma4